MNRIVVCADVHVGNHRRMGGSFTSGLNHRCHHVLATLARACDHVGRNDAFVVAGDLFDTDAPSPQILAAVARVLMKCAGEIYLVVGNHDRTSWQAGHHALVALEGLPRVHVVERPSLFDLGGSDLILLPAGTSLVAASELCAVCTRGRPRILAMHAGVIDASTAPWLRNDSRAVFLDDLLTFMDGHGIELTISGDWHERKEWNMASGRRVIQQGSLCPTGFDDTTPEHGVTIVTMVERGPCVKFVPVPGPRFVATRTREELQDLVEHVRCTRPALSGYPHYVSHRGDVSDGAGCHDYLNTFEGFELVPDLGSQEETEAVLQPVRSAQSLLEQLTAYVYKSYPERAEKAAMLVERGRGYLGL